MPKKSEFTYENNLDDIKKELEIASKADPASKDILIVVKDQKDYLENCLESILEHTSDSYHIYIWDNGSSKETTDYIWGMTEGYSDITCTSSPNNVGFIYPNNRLAETGKGDYIILLNSDTVVRPMWDKAMVGWLQANPDCAEVGYLGGWLDSNGRGHRFGFGDDVDYLCGWGICISRKTYDEFGLFDENNLIFAYAEDSDLSLRLRDAGKKIYGLRSDLVVHYENKTINEVQKEMDIEEPFMHNHEYIKQKWEKYLDK
ncbi:MAG: glycosyltransferase family 2 protein [Candidatus Thorarchaeota archaeon]|jgi:GT2 family glycosyltransferase